MKNFESINELKKHFIGLKGLTLEKIYQNVQAEYPHIVLNTNKGIVGQVLESTTGRPPNSNPNPDIGELGVELKVLPVRRSGHELKPKERSKIKSINYNEIVDEAWISSAVRVKIKLILFLVYEQPTGFSYRDWKAFVFKNALLFNLESENESVIENDWRKIKEVVASNTAHLLSEGDGDIMGACTSGSGRLKVYNGSFQAKERSYSFKHSYMRLFYKEKTRVKPFYKLKKTNNISAENYVVNRLNEELHGKALLDVVKSHGLKFNQSSKSSFKSLINSVLKIPKNKEVYDLAFKNIMIKTIPVNDKKKPWEAMSFPKFSLVDLLNESWEFDEEKDSCTFKSLVTQPFIFIPVIKEKEVCIRKGKKTKCFKSWETWRIGKSFVWKISSDDLSRVKKEWVMAKEIVGAGVKTKKVKYGKGWRQENNLIKQSSTSVIHIRPHAKNSSDIDLPFLEKQKIKISWQSFWLNNGFVKGLIKELG
jgi:DNA mismatch repair endonuclease MutH